MKARLFGTVLTLSAMLVVAGCASSAERGPSVESAAVIAPVAPGAMPMPASPDFSFAYDTASIQAVGGVAAGGGEISIEMPINVEGALDQTNREIIVTGNVELAADDPVAISSQIAAYIESIGGNVASRNEWRGTPTSPGGASLSLRIPAGSLNSVIDTLSQFGEVRSTWVNQMDVTAQAVDLDARISALQTSVTRLTELMSDAADTADLLNVERELSRRQADLDSLRAQRNDFTGRVQMSTLDINIVPTPSAIEFSDPHPGFIGGLQRGWNALVGFARGLAVAIGAILPWLLAAGVIAALLTPLVRWFRKRKVKRYQTKAGQQADVRSEAMRQFRSETENLIDND